jgi:hypothetical protein
MFCVTVLGERSVIGWTRAFGLRRFRIGYWIHKYSNQTVMLVVTAANLFVLALRRLSGNPVDPRVKMHLPEADSPNLEMKGFAIQASRSAQTRSGWEYESLVGEPA